MYGTYTIIINSIFSGLKIVIPLLFIVRLIKWKITKLNEFALIEAINVLILFSSFLYPLFLIVDFITIYFSGAEYEQYTIITRLTGPYWWAYVIPLFGTVLLPQLIWLKRVRASVKISYAWFILSSISPWFEFFVMVSTSLHRDYITSSIGSMAVNYYFFPSVSAKSMYLLIGIAVLIIVYLVLLKKKNRLYNKSLV
jgi:hypothetical protein